MNNIFRFFYRFLPRKSILLLFLSVVFLGACKTSKKITFNNGKCLIEPKTAKSLTKHLKENEFRFDKLNAKLSVEATVDSSSNSFTVTLRMKKDSIIWMSISKLGIEGARVLITKDTVKFMNRIKSQYFIGDFSYISKIINTDLDFEILQSLLVGNSVEFYDDDEKLKPGVDDCKYYLGTVRKRKMKRIIEKGKEYKDAAQTIYMVPDKFKITRIVFFEFNPDRNIDVRYDNFVSIDSTQLFPQKISCNIKAQKSVIIEMNYTKTVFNEEQTFPFKIPENYEQIVVKEK
jgi:hypothetical protein